MGKKLLIEINRMNELMGIDNQKIILNEQDKALTIISRALGIAGPNVVLAAARKGMEKTVQNYIIRANNIGPNFTQGVSNLPKPQLADLSSSINFSKLPENALWGALGFRINTNRYANDLLVGILSSTDRVGAYTVRVNQIKSMTKPFQNTYQNDPSITQVDRDLLKRLDNAVAIKQIDELDNVIRANNPKLYTDIQSSKGGVGLRDKELPAKGQGKKASPLAKGYVTRELEKFMGSTIDAVNKGGQDYVEKKIEETLGYIRTLVDGVESGKQIPETEILALTDSIERNLLAISDDYAPNWDKVYGELGDLLTVNNVSDEDKSTIINYFKNSETWKKPYDPITAPIGYQQWSRWKKFMHGTVGERVLRETFGRGSSFGTRILNLIKRFLNNYLFGFFRTLREWNEFTQLYGARKGTWLFYKYGMIVSKILWPIVSGIFVGIKNICISLGESDPEKKGLTFYIVDELYEGIKSQFLRSISFEEDNYGIDRWLNELDIKSVEYVVDVVTGLLPTNFGVDNLADYLLSGFKTGSADDVIKKFYKDIDTFIEDIKSGKLNPLEEETFQKWCDLVGYKKTNWTPAEGNESAFGSAMIKDGTVKNFSWCRSQFYYVEVGKCVGIKLPSDTTIINKGDSLKNKEIFRQKGKAKGFKEFLENEGYTIEGSKWCPVYNVGFTSDGKAWWFKDGMWVEFYAATQMGIEKYCEGSTINLLK